jgi:hypothetical protein
VDAGAHPPGDFVFPVVFLVAGDGREFSQVFGDRRIEFFLQQRDD